jgi:hypothetical protein
MHSRLCFKNEQSDKREVTTVKIDLVSGMSTKNQGKEEDELSESDRFGDIINRVDFD